MTEEAQAAPEEGTAARMVYDLAQGLAQERPTEMVITSVSPALMQRTYAAGMPGRVLPEDQISAYTQAALTQCSKLSRKLGLRVVAWGITSGPVADAQGEVEMALALKTRKDLASGGSLRTTQLAGISLDVVRTEEGRWTMEDLALRVETPAGSSKVNLVEAIEQHHAREVASTVVHSHRP